MREIDNSNQEANHRQYTDYRPVDRNAPATVNPFLLDKWIAGRFTHACWRGV